MECRVHFTNIVHKSGNPVPYHMAGAVLEGDTIEDILSDLYECYVFAKFNKFILEDMNVRMSPPLSTLRKAINFRMPKKRIQFRPDYEDLSPKEVLEHVTVETGTVEDQLKARLSAEVIRESMEKRGE